MKKINKNCSEFVMSANEGHISGGPPCPDPNPGSTREYRIV